MKYSEVYFVGSKSFEPSIALYSIVREVLDTYPFVKLHYIETKDVSNKQMKKKLKAVPHVFFNYAEIVGLKSQEEVEKFFEDQIRGMTENLL